VRYRRVDMPFDIVVFAGHSKEREVAIEPLSTDQSVRLSRSIADYGNFRSSNIS
jgi:hypothetical protein